MCCDEDYQELSSQVTIIIIQSNKLSTLVIALCMLNNPLWLHSAKQPNTIHCPRCCHREEGSQLACKGRGSAVAGIGYRIYQIITRRECMTAHIRMPFQGW